MKAVLRILLTIFALIAIVMIFYSFTGYITRTTGYSITELKKEKGNLVFFFYSKECVTCSEMGQFLDELATKYDIKIKKFEAWKNKEANKLFLKLVGAYGVEGALPCVFVNKKVFVGFSDKIKKQIEEEIRDCVINKCENPVESINN